MGAIAITEVTVEAPLEATFARFIDFSSWDRWAPASFVPICGPARRLREADTIRVGIGPRGRLSVQLRVIRVRPNKEICWRGGVPGLLQAEHSYFFNDSAGKTRVRSEEPWSGLLASGPLSKRIEHEARIAAESILQSFAAHLQDSGSSARSARTPRQAYG